MFNENNFITFWPSFFFCEFLLVWVLNDTITITSFFYNHKNKYPSLQQSWKRSNTSLFFMFFAQKGWESIDNCRAVQKWSPGLWMLTTKQSSWPLEWIPSASSCKQIGGVCVASMVPFQRKPGVNGTGRLNLRLPTGGTA